jgi:TolB-like protein
LRPNHPYRRIFFTALLLASVAAAREKITVAVLDFEPKNIERESAEAITDLLRTELFNTGRFMVVERQKIQKILEEQKFQMSGLTDTDQAAQIGRLLNVKKIMIGSITRLGNTQILNTRILDVQSGVVELAEAVECKGDEENLPAAVTELSLKVSYKIGLEGSIIRITGEVLYIDLGAADGVKVGDVFSVIRTGETVTDLEGRVIGTNSEAIGSLMITKAQDRFSEAAVKEGSRAFQRGDKVKPEEEGARYAEPGREVKKETRKDAPREKKAKREQAPSDQKTINVPPVF